MTNKGRRQLIMVVMISGVALSATLYEAYRNSHERVSARSKPTASPRAVEYDPVRVVNGPGTPYRGEIRFEVELTTNQGKTELVVRTIRPNDRHMVLYAEHFHVRCADDSKPKVDLIPLESPGMVTECTRFGVATGMIRYRVDGAEPIKTTGTCDLIVRYLDQDHPLLLGTSDRN